MLGPINDNRRRIVGAALVALAAFRFSAASAATAHNGFGALRRINAGVLDVAYAEAGPAGGRPVILLHGWPYDIHSFVEVTPRLAAAGYRVIVPYLRGYGATRFLSDETFRNGQQSAVALDIIALMDALKIEKAIVGGFDWGARTVCIMAALWPERCRGVVSVSGYLIGSPEANGMPLPPEGSSTGGTSITSPPNAGGPAMRSTRATLPG